MDTCILEMLYWTNQSRRIMGEARSCFEDLEQTDIKGKQNCVREARLKYADVQEMTEQMVQVSKEELSKPTVTPSQ